MGRGRLLLVPGRGEGLLHQGSLSEGIGYSANIGYSAELAAQFHDSPENPTGPGRWTERFEGGILRTQFHPVLPQVEPLHRGFLFEERHHDLTGNWRPLAFDDDGVAGQDAGPGHAFPSHPECEIVREVPGIGDLYREIPLRVLDGLFETAGGDFAQKGDRLKAVGRPA